MELEIFKSSYGYYNLRTKNGSPTEEMIRYLKENGYRWSYNNNCWYPSTNNAKGKNLRGDFVSEFQKRFFAPEENEPKIKVDNSFEQKSQPSKEDISPKNDRTVQLERLVAELRAQLQQDKEKIAELEAKLKSIDKKQENPSILIGANEKTDVSDDIRSSQEYEAKKQFSPQPVTLEEILSVMELNPEMTSEGKIRVFDIQRGEYIDNFGDEEFTNAEEIFERLDTYIYDYFIHDMEEQLEAVGVDIDKANTLSDLCSLYQKEIEKGNSRLSEDELNLAFGIVHPDTVILPEPDRQMSVENNVESSVTESPLVSQKDMKQIRAQCREILKKVILRLRKPIWLSFLSMKAAADFQKKIAPTQKFLTPFILRITSSKRCGILWILMLRMPRLYWSRLPEPEDLQKTAPIMSLPCTKLMKRPQESIRFFIQKRISFKEHIKNSSLMMASGLKRRTMSSQNMM